MSAAMKPDMLDVYDELTLAHSRIATLAELILQLTSGIDQGKAVAKIHVLSHAITEECRASVSRAERLIGHGGQR